MVTEYIGNNWAAISITCIWQYEMVWQVLESEASVQILASLFISWVTLSLYLISLSFIYRLEKMVVPQKSIMMVGLNVKMHTLYMISSP